MFTSEPSLSLSLSLSAVMMQPRAHLFTAYIQKTSTCPPDCLLQLFYCLLFASLSLPFYAHTVHLYLFLFFLTLPFFFIRTLNHEASSACICIKMCFQFIDFQFNWCMWDCFVFLIIVPWLFLFILTFSNTFKPCSHVADILENVVFSFCFEKVEKSIHFQCFYVSCWLINVLGLGLSWLVIRLFLCAL